MRSLFWTTKGNLEDMTFTNIDFLVLHRPMEMITVPMVKYMQINIYFHHKIIHISINFYFATFDQTKVFCELILLAFVWDQLNT